MVGVNASPWPLFPQERPCTHCTGGWMSLRADLEGCGKSRPHRDLILTVQPVASRYTDWAIPAPSKETIFLLNCDTSERQTKDSHTHALTHRRRTSWHVFLRYLQSTTRSRFGAIGIVPNILNIGTVHGNERYLHIPAALTLVPIQYEVCRPPRVIWPLWRIRSKYGELRRFPPHTWKTAAPLIASREANAAV